MSTVNAVTIYAENLQGANLVVGNTSSNLTVTANSIAISIGNVTVNSTAIKVISPISSTQNTTINSTALAANTLKLNGTDYNGIVGDTVLVDYQVFTNPLVANFWYKPAWAQDNDIVTIQMWGGGGGGISPSGAGGGGGACVIVNKLASECNAICNVVVGSGGEPNNNGNSSIFYTNSTFFITAYAGSTGVGTNDGGGGGGWFSSGNGVSGGGPIGGNSTIVDSTFGGGYGRSTSIGGSSIYGGGGGVKETTGGKSLYGGGGGAENGIGGSSIFGGAGGNSTVQATIPGGGGGKGLAGARGEVRVWITGQARQAGDALPYYFITPNTTTMVQNTSVSFTVSTINVANGTTLHYTLNNSSQAVSSDFTTAVNGSIVINGGSNTFTLTANTDGDAPETFYMDLRTGSSTGTIVANTNSISIYAIPTLISSTKTLTGSGTTHTANLPASIAAGELILVAVAVPPGVTFTWPAGWTEYTDDIGPSGGGASGSMTIGYKVADGGETTVTVTASGSSQEYKSISMRISGHQSSLNKSDVVKVTSKTPNPGSVNFKTGLYLVISGGGSDGGPITAYTPPSDYTIVDSYTGGEEEAWIAIAKLESGASSSDPGPWTITGSTVNGIHYTIAI